jgi:hypothetical protein
MAGNCNTPALSFVLHPILNGMQNVGGCLFFVITVLSWSARNELKATFNYAFFADESSGGYQFVTVDSTAGTSVALTGTYPVRPCVSIVEINEANSGAMVASFTDNDNIVLKYFSVNGNVLGLASAPNFELLIQSTGKYGTMGLLAARE